MSDLGPIFTAQFEGVCLACEERIYPGEDIKAVLSAGEYIHADTQCERMGQMPLSLACPRCFQVPSVSGACGCDS